MCLSYGDRPMAPKASHISTFLIFLFQLPCHGVLRISCVYLETQICYETICYKVFSISVKMLWFANPFYFKK